MPLTTAARRNQMARTLAEVACQLVIVVDRVVLLDNAEILQLTVKRPLRDGGLRDVGTVQVVHAVGPDDTRLQLDWFLLVCVQMEVPSRSC